MPKSMENIESQSKQKEMKNAISPLAKSHGRKLQLHANYNFSNFFVKRIIVYC